MNHVNHPDQKVDALLASAIKLLKEDPRRPRWVIGTPHAFVNSDPKGFDSNCAVCEGKHRDAIHNEVPVNTTPEGVDTAFDVWSNQVSSLSTRRDATKPKEPTMAKADKSPKSTLNAFESVTPKAGSVTVDAEGNKTTHNPLPEKTSTKQDLKAAEAKAKIEAKAAKKAESEAKKAAAQAAREAKSTTTAAEHEAKKLERQARMDALKAEGKGYVGSMLALADKVKQGLYVKSATGQLRSTNELAQAFDGVTVLGVIGACKDLLGLEANPYVHLNVGQQSMNLRNKVRGAISKGTLTIEQVREYIAKNDLDVSASLRAESEAKAARIAAAKAEREAKAATKPAKTVKEAEAVA